MKKMTTKYSSSCSGNFFFIQIKMQTKLFMFSNSFISYTIIILLPSIKLYLFLFGESKIALIVYSSMQYLINICVRFLIWQTTVLYFALTLPAEQWTQLSSFWLLGRYYFEEDDHVITHCLLNCFFLFHYKVKFTKSLYKWKNLFVFYQK